jgi:hypothetical protein
MDQIFFTLRASKVQTQSRLSVALVQKVFKVKSSTLNH